DQTSTRPLRIAGARLISKLPYARPEIHNCRHTENHRAGAFLSIVAERSDFRTGWQLQGGCAAYRFGECECRPRCGWTAGNTTEDPRSSRGRRRSENRGSRKQGDKSGNRTLETAEREGGTRRQIRRSAKADRRGKPSSEHFAKSDPRTKTSATGTLRAVRRNCTRACRRSNPSSAVGTEAQENCATQGTTGGKQL